MLLFLAALFKAYASVHRPSAARIIISYSQSATKVTADLVLNYGNNRVHTLKIVNIAVLNDRRENKFPVNFKKPVIFKIDVINNGTAVTPTTAYIDIEGYAQALYFNCDWYPFPTFGLLQGVLPSMPGEAWKWYIRILSYKFKNLKLLRQAAKRVYDTH
ncbi:hypothetical protein M513_09699 [Trichuris suis]|uniref:Uncharacterized protein n=1 Tax=Trichuris suis TaxID=68888 RepID=A0A085LWT6_9BILA|nr:hypothetical protein M513_09699 [Trichuris suis]